MNSTDIRDQLDHMAGLPGITACALVDGDTGMVWHATSQHDGAEVLAEAAIDYWRLYRRLHKHFDALGELQTSVMMHANGMITLAPCGSEMVVVAVAHRQQADWNQWQREVKVMEQLLRR